MAGAAPHPWEWHGTQTSVVAAGDGSLSEGVYRGLAHSARVVLVQVGREGSIHEDEIARAFEWLLEHHRELGVRVVNVSLGGDHEAPLEASRVNQLAEEAVRQGLVVVVAAGNSGCTSEHAPVPPASAPSVITVGGYHDWTNEEGRSFALYCSSFGNTPDGVQKPDLLAPAMEVAAPILQGTPEYRVAEALTLLTTASDGDLPRLAARHAGHGRSSGGRFLTRPGRDPRSRGPQAPGAEDRLRPLPARGRDLVRGADRRFDRGADARGERGSRPRGRQGDPDPRPPSGSRGRRPNARDTGWSTRVGRSRPRGHSGAAEAAAIASCSEWSRRPDLNR